METFYYQSPLGILKIVTKDNYLIEINISNEKTTKPTNILQTEIKKQLDEYFNNQRIVFNLPITFNGTPFQEKVWSELLNVSFGETISYYELAKRVKSPKAYRAVGGALSKNNLLIVIPCHRVIGKNKTLTGFAGGLAIKEQLLRHENNDY